MNLQVNLTKRVQTNAGLRYYPVVFARNGRVKPDVVFIDGIEERHPEGAYYLDWYEGSKRKRLSVGKDAAMAFARKMRKQAELNAKAQGVPIAPEAQEQSGQSLQAAIDQYVEETRLTKKKKTLAAYSVALRYFAASCSKLYLEEIERADMLRFHAYLRDEKEQTPRSCWNKFSNVMSFLKAQGVNAGVRKNDWPRYVEDTPAVYEKADLEKLFAVCSAQEKLYFEFFLKTGMREQEVMHTFWSDVNFARGTITVSAKPQFGFTPKNYKGREIPIPSNLIHDLKAAKAKATSSCQLLFPTSGCKPKNDFLDTLKARAKEAELNPDDFWLHRFRATFATWHLQAGVDLRTVQQWLGHTDMESTLRYLKPARSHTMRAKVDATFA
jgi:integrase/recombinase XerD